MSFEEQLTEKLNLAAQTYINQYNEKIKLDVLNHQYLKEEIERMLKAKFPGKIQRMNEYGYTMRIDTFSSNDLTLQDLIYIENTCGWKYRGKNSAGHLFDQPINGNFVGPDNHMHWWDYMDDYQKLRNKIRGDDAFSTQLHEALTHHHRKIPDWWRKYD